MVLTGNSAFIHGTWVTSLVSVSEDPSDYCGTIINLGESELEDIPPLLLPTGMKWAYHYGSCSWHQVTNSFYEQILSKGKVNRIKTSHPYKLNAAFLQDTLSFETVSNLGRVGNIELFPEKLGLIKKRLIEFKKPDGTQYTELEEEDYLVAVNPIGPTWRIIPKNSLIGEPFKSIDGSIRWRPNVAGNLLYQAKLNLTGKVAFISSDWEPELKYGYNELRDPKPEDFAAYLSNYNRHNPLYRAPAEFYRYHLEHGMWYQMDHQSCVSIEKANRTGSIEKYNRGGIQYNPTKNQATTKVNVIEINGELSKVLNKDKLLLRPDQIIETEHEVCLLVDLVNRTSVPKDTSTVQTNNKIAIKKWGWIYGISELYEYNQVCHFSAVEGPTEPDPGYKYCYHLKFCIWFQITDDSYQRVRSEGNIPDSSSAISPVPGPISLAEVTLGAPDLTTFINPTTLKNYQPGDRQSFIVLLVADEWKAMKADTFIWGVMKIQDENNYRASYWEPTTISQFWKDNGITESIQSVVNYNRCAFLDTISQTWATGTVKLNLTTGLPENFYLDPSPYTDFAKYSITNTTRVDIKPKPGYVWAYHLEHKLWYEVNSLSAGKIIASATKKPDFILDFIPDDLPAFMGQYTISNDYSLRKSLSELVVLEDGVPLVAPASSICVTREGGYRLSTLGIMIADYTNQTELYLTNRAVIKYENIYRIGLNIPESGVHYRIRPIDFPSAPDCCWVYGGHEIWQEVTRESFISVLLSGINKNAAIKEVIPLEGSINEATGSFIILEDQSTKSDPICDYYQKCYSEEEKTVLVNTDLGSLRHDSIIRMNSDGHRLLLVGDLLDLNEQVIPYQSKLNAWFKSAYWMNGVAQPDKFDPSLFSSKVMMEIPSNAGYFWHQYSAQGVYYQFDLNTSVRISLVGLVNNPPVTIPNIPIIGLDLSILDSTSNPIQAYNYHTKSKIELDRGTIVAVKIGEKYQLNLADNINSTNKNTNNLLYIGISITSVLITITVIILALIPA